MPVRQAAAKRSPWPSNAIGSGTTLTVGTEAADVITVTVQFKDVNHVNLAQRVGCKYYLSTDAEGDNLASAPTGGVAAGAAGLVIEDVTDVSGWLVSNSSGVVNVAITDSGTPTLYLILILPDGTLKQSGAITFA